MSFSTRTQHQNSEIIQDTVPDTNLDNEGDQLSATLNNLTLAKLARMIYGLWALIGPTGRRRGSTYFTGADVSLTGTITSSGVTVTGSSSLFLTELEVGDFIAGTANEFREVQAISLSTSLTLVSAFSVNIGSAQVYKRRRKLSERLDSFTIARGLIIGGLIFNSATLPPTITAGIYEVNGKSISLTANATLALSDTILQSRQALDSFCHYLVVINNAGDKRYVLYGEGAVATANGNITSISGAGTTKTLTVSSGTAVSAVSKILVITGNDGVNGVFKITGGNGSTTYTFESQAVLTGTNVGQWQVYERTSTLHGTGSNTAVTVDASVLFYTPSYAENGWAAGIVAWNDILGGYYLTIAGLTEYRVIGNFRTNTTPNVVTDIVSHKTGRDKNDNDWYVHTQASQVTNAIRFSTIVRLFGCDYKYIDNGSIGSEWQIQRNCLAQPTYIASSSATATNASLLISQVSTNTQSGTAHDQYAIIGFGATADYPYAISPCRYATPGMILKPLVSSGSSSANVQRFAGTLIL